MRPRQSREPLIMGQLEHDQHLNGGVRLEELDEHE
jgi:hypothetical protein